MMTTLGYALLALLAREPQTGYDLDTAVADLLALISVLELDRPVLAGQSWGGNVVLELGWRRPETVRGNTGPRNTGAVGENRNRHGRQRHQRHRRIVQEEIAEGLGCQGDPGRRTKQSRGVGFQSRTPFGQPQDAGLESHAPARGLETEAAPKPRLQVCYRAFSWFNCQL